MSAPDRPNFEGHESRECGEHRTVGSHRAWCHDCTTWCCPLGPCPGCELPALRARVAVLEGVGRRIVADYEDGEFGITEIKALRKVLDGES